MRPGNPGFGFLHQDRISSFSLLNFYFIPGKMIFKNYLSRMRKEIKKGQGAVNNIHNRFEANTYEKTIYDDFTEEPDIKTQWIEVFPKTILNVVKSADLPMDYSLNPYQGCEHGCSYCYARPTHEYWGYSAGIDFERKIMVKKNAAELLRKTFEKRSYIPKPIMLSGNTDCYQPVEKKLKLTRSILEVCLEYKNPLSIITKNALVLRDLDLLAEMAKHNLVHVSISMPTTDENLRKVMEPRTSSIQNKLKAIETLAGNNIPVNVMLAPIIPGLNSHEILHNLKLIREKGASSFGYTLVRLNDAVEPVFVEWITAHYPDKAQKVIHLIQEIHGGNLGDKRTFLRMKGEGKVAEMIHHSFKVGKQKYFPDVEYTPLNCNDFAIPGKGNQLRLF